MSDLDDRPDGPATDHTRDRAAPAPARDADDGRPLEPLLRELAEAYHRPPAAPREAMWAAIRAARDEDRAAARGSATPADVVALPPVALVVSRGDAGRPPGGAPAGRRWTAAAAALAAALLLGVGLDRWTARDGGPSGAPGGRAGAAPVVVAGAPPRSDDRADVAAERDPDAAARGGTPPAADVVAGAPPRSNDAAALPDARTPRTADRIAAPRARLAAASPAAVRPTAPAPAAGAGTVAARLGDGYRIATVQHLGQAEALLTAFRAESGADAATLAATDAWAGELLTTTRLLLDSPAAADPQLGPLLGDLEDVLVQIVHVPAARAAGERRLIAQSLDQSQLMTHLRAAVPSGPAAPQRSGE